jgi:hypothetical protein
MDGLKWPYGEVAKDLMEARRKAVRKLIKAISTAIWRVGGAVLVGMAVGDYCGSSTMGLAAAVSLLVLAPELPE